MLGGDKDGRYRVSKERQERKLLRSPSDSEMRREAAAEISLAWGGGGWTAGSQYGGGRWLWVTV